MVNGQCLNSSVEPSAEAGGDDDPDGGDAEHPDEEGAEDGDPDVGPGDVGCLGHLEGGRRDEGYDAGTYAAEGSRHPGVVLELTEEEGYGEDDEEGGHDAAEGGGEGSAHALQLIAYEDGYVHGEDAGARLRHGHQVEEVLATYPLLLLNDFGFDEGDHGVAAADGEEADVEEGGE